MLCNFSRKIQIRGSQLTGLVLDAVNLMIHAGYLLAQLITLRQNRCFCGVLVRVHYTLQRGHLAEEMIKVCFQRIPTQLSGLHQLHVLDTLLLRTAHGISTGRSIRSTWTNCCALCRTTSSALLTASSSSSSCIS